MEDFPSQPAPVPGPPPELNRVRLWVSLLAPPVAALVLSAVFFILVLRSNSLQSLNALGPICIIACVAILGFWALYIHTLSKRFRGSSLVLLILAYPILQVVLSLAIFFTGCLGAAFIEG